MSTFADVLISSFSQLGVVLVITLLAFGLTKLFSKQAASYLDFMGFRKPGRQLDKSFGLILIAITVFAGASVLIQFHFSTASRELLLSDTSPFIKILKSGFGLTQLGSAILYCFVQSGGAEEVLFRGLIARRLFAKLGFLVGNVLQAAIFWLMHLLIFKLVTGSWVSWIQLYIFAFSFGLGLVLGFVNARRGGRSIAPSWLIHGTTNLATYIVLGFVTRNAL